MNPTDQPPVQPPGNPDESPQCRRCGDTGKLPVPLNVTTSPYCPCPAGVELAGWLADVMTLAGLAGQYRPLGICSGVS